ncbi:MAG: hypothetical protein HN884_06900 [Rhodospirillaceae bacterium]|nr:hypothetical protein [Rhodospirillaceae bacterium]MBT7266584.1 hypothetical protein [Rhodospirillaceae bacterium]
MGKIIGWMLLALAIGFAAVETGAQGVAKQYGIMSAYTVLHTLVPGELVQTRIFIEKSLHPVLWDPIIRSLLWLPGWLLLGMPGVFFAWKFRDRRSAEDRADDDILVSSYDDILAAAEEFDEHIHNEDDSAPSKYGHLSDFDPAANHAQEDGLDAFKLEPKHVARPKKK